MVIVTKLFKETNLHKIFEIGIIIKAFDGVLELLGAGLLFLASKEQVNNLIIRLTQHELSEEPQDYIATHIVQAFEHYSLSTKIFEVSYLVIHGAIKIFLVWALLKNKLWAYPVTLALLGIFIVYQIYRYSFTGSIGLAALTIFDAIVFALTWHEYNYRRNLTKTI